MALPSLTKTRYTGISYYRDSVKGKVFVATFTINKKKYRKIIGHENDELKTNEKIAFIKKEQLKEDIKNGKNIKNKELLFIDLYTLYLDHIISSKSCSSKTIKNKQSTFNAHFKNNLSNIKINSISNLDIQKIANNLLKNKAPKTVQNIISDLAAIFEFAIKHKFLNENPAKNIDLPKFDNEKIFPLNEEESKRLFNTIINYEEPLYRAIFTFLLEGRRKDEVLSITWDMIDLERKIYTIKYEDNKAKKNMFYEMTDELYSNLITFKDQKGLVFKSPVTNKKIQNIRYAWNRILKAAKIDKKITIHELRHLLGYTLKNYGNKSDEIIAAVLGQKTTRSTKRYAKVRQKVAASGLKEAFSYLKQ
ncbi:MAG: tyrosine-type recombinase/integrase [Halarcobacter ebronensis]|uniref:tyrosine-type recombinase/integrase n=1 Tax=Halarcobacter ebronensis TaxID=1462615 RepID=UPI003C7119D5